MFYKFLKNKLSVILLGGKEKSHKNSHNLYEINQLKIEKKIFEKIKISFKVSCAILFLTPQHSLFGQDFELGGWNILNLKYTHNDNWSFFGETQLRSLKFYNHFHYYEYKGAINYQFYKDACLTLGAGSYQTYKEDGNFMLPKNNDELRIWPQLILFQVLGKIKTEQRYRSELRWTNQGYQNRFRYRLGISYAFGKEQKIYKPFQISASNELFFTDKEPYFERNRLLLSLNYKPQKAISLQIAYLHQFDYKINDETGKKFILMGLYYEMFRKNGLKKNENEIKDN